jgi:hypothetical protein
MTDFKRELTTLLNRYSIENDSDTPDFILAEYILKSLEAFETATKIRDEWYGDIEKWHQTIG